MEETIIQPNVPTQTPPPINPPLPVANPQPVPTPTPQPPISTAFQPPPTQTPPPAPSQKTNSSPLKLALGLSLLILILFLGATGIFAYAITYKDFSVGNPSLEQNIANLVQSIPQTPKTPIFILKKSLSIHQKVAKHSFDVSLAVDTNTLSSYGLSQIDVKVKGDADYSDPKNIQFSLNSSISKDLNFDLKKKNTMLYAKINKLPWLIITPMIASFVPNLDHNKIDSIITSNWIGYDVSPLDSSARKSLDETKTQTSITNEIIKNSVDVLTNKQIIGHLTVADSTEQGVSYYKISFKPDGPLLDEIESIYNKNTNTASLYTKAPKASETYKDVSMEVLVDKNSYYVKKLSISFSFIPPSGLASSYLPIGSSAKQSDVKVVMVVMLDNFGNPVVIDAPNKWIKPEDLMDQVVKEASLSALFDPKAQYAKANDTKRKSDVNAILNAVRQYMADHKNTFPVRLPTINKNAEISSTELNICYLLVPNYIAALPVDPTIENGTPVTDCKKSYRTGYEITTGTNKAITVSAQYSEGTTQITVTR